MSYEIVDRRTDKVVATCKSLSGALRSVNRRDNAYGACRYYARPIQNRSAA